MHGTYTKAYMHVTLCLKFDWMQLVFHKFHNKVVVKNHCISSKYPNPFEFFKIFEIYMNFRYIVRHVVI